MNGVNKAIIVGTLGKDPEIRYMQNGNAVASLSVATNESWTDKNTGERQTATEWHKISVFGKLAEIIGEYLKKGSKAYFEGKIQTRKWQDIEGNDRFSTEIVANQMQMLDSKNENQPQQRQTQNSQPQQRTQQQNKTGYSQPPPKTQGDFDDDIPF